MYTAEISRRLHKLNIGRVEFYTGLTLAVTGVKVVCHLNEAFCINAVFCFCQVFSWRSYHVMTTHSTHASDTVIHTYSFATVVVHFVPIQTSTRSPGMW